MSVSPSFVITAFVHARASFAQPRLRMTSRSARACVLAREPYDKERAAQIRTAVDRARCDRLNSDELVLKNKYRGKAKVFEAIEKAKQLAM